MLAEFSLDKRYSYNQEISRNKMMEIDSKGL
jgi:hypothetical protein